MPGFNPSGSNFTTTRWTVLGRHARTATPYGVGYSCALDPELTLEIMDLIAAAAMRGTTVVVATHDHSLIERYGKTADFSRLDWMIATDMAKSGRFSAQGIAGAIEKHSPEVATRKAGHVEDYAKRTAEKAWAAPEVQAHRQEQQAEQALQHGARFRSGEVALA